MSSEASCDRKSFIEDIFRSVKSLHKMYAFVIASSTKNQKMYDIFVNFAALNSEAVVTS